jgi:hypothetical protein
VERFRSLFDRSSNTAGHSASLVHETTSWTVFYPGTWNSRRNTYHFQGRLGRYLETQSDRPRRLVGRKPRSTSLPRCMEAGGLSERVFTPLGLRPPAHARALSWKGHDVDTWKAKSELAGDPGSYEQALPEIRRGV